MAGCAQSRAEQTLQQSCGMIALAPRSISSYICKLSVSASAPVNDGDAAALSRSVTVAPLAAAGAPDRVRLAGQHGRGGAGSGLARPGHTNSLA
jgi:hypothetical protein